MHFFFLAEWVLIERVFTEAGADPCDYLIDFQVIIIIIIIIMVIYIVHPICRETRRRFTK